MDRRKKERSGAGELRKFGLTFGGALGAVAAVQFLRGRAAAPWFLSVSALMVFLALLWPRALSPVRKALENVARAAGWLLTRITLALVFYLVVTPMGLIMRLSGNDPLEKRMEKGMESYWSEREKGTASAASLERQF